MAESTEKQEVAATESVEDLQKVDESKLAKMIEEVTVEEVSKMQNFLDLAKDLRLKQKELDIMAADTLPAAILTSYLSDVLEPNNNGDLISIVSSSPEVQSVVQSIYDELSIPVEKVINSLLKNGIAICEFDREKIKKDDISKMLAANEHLSKSQKAAAEEIFVKTNYTRVLPSITMIQDTSLIFPILEKEKCTGFIEVKKKERLEGFKWMEDFLNDADIIIHSDKDFSYVKFGVSRSSEPLQLKVRDTDGNISVYDIDVGCSLLENSWSAWKTLSILLDSVVMASMIQNAQSIVVQCEVGQASEADIEALKIKIKSLFEGKLALGKDGMKTYLAPSPKPNYIYSFTQGGQGAISTTTIGGEYKPGQLFYINPYLNQFFAGMNAVKQNYGFTEDSGGFDGGGSVEEYNKRYLATVSQFKRLVAKFIKNCINNVLLSRGLLNLVDDFDVVVYKAYKEEDQAIAQMQQQQLQIMQDLVNFADIQDPIRLRNLKIAVIKKVFSDKTLVEAFEKALMEEVPDPDPEDHETNEGEEDMGLDESNSSMGADTMLSDLGEGLDDLGEDEESGEDDGDDIPNLPNLTGSELDDEELITK